MRRRAALYQAARQRSPISVMLQLGEQADAIVRGVHAGDGAGGSGVRRQRDAAAMEISEQPGTGDGG